MLVLRYGVLAALAFLPAFAQDSSTSPSQDTAGNTVMRRFGPIRDKVESGFSTATSTNWSGYAVTGSSFTSAEGSWIVPAVDCSGGRATYVAFWVGIDGYSSDTVEQTGTESTCVGTSAEYSAWYEFYPSASVTISSVPVKPGNVVTASVTYSGGEFTTTIKNVTTGASYSTSGTVSGADRSSAEWIAEAPCCTLTGGILPMADFGTGYFGLDYSGVTATNAATDSTTTGPISSFSSAVEINKVSSRTSPQTSTCSALSSDGTSFTCTWGN
jgi:hypothetical protein